MADGCESIAEVSFRGCRRDLESFFFAAHFAGDSRGRQRAVRMMGFDMFLRELE